MVAASLPLLIAAGCAQPQAEAVGHLARASVAIRGVRPSIREIETVAASPDRLGEIVDGWFDDPGFGDTVRDMHGAQFLLRIDTRPHLEPVGPLSSYTQAEIIASLDEEALRLIERIVVEGRPYTEIVTADTTMADPIVSAAHGPPHDPDGPEWQETVWPDGRPAAGILSSTSLWQRHMSSNTNHHRTRASFVLSKLLCAPFPAGSVVSDPTLTDALREEPACAGCHDTLDPLSAAFAGFRDYVLPRDNRNATERGCPPEGAHLCAPIAMWDPTLAPPPLPPAALAGRPVADLADLGRAVADDPRFAACTARRFAAWLHATPEQDVPNDRVEALARTLVAADFDVRQLVRAIVTDPAYAPSGSTPPMPMRGGQLEAFVEDLTGLAPMTATSADGQANMTSLPMFLESMTM